MTAHVDRSALVTPSSSRDDLRATSPSSSPPPLSNDEGEIQHHFEDTHSDRDHSPVASDDHSPVASDASSSRFGYWAERQAKRHAGHVCWACETSPTQVCEVFMRDDPQIEDWYDKNLIDFDIDTADNAIALCKSCHEEYERVLDPGFVFLPADLQFFIDYELADRRRRGPGPSDRPDCYRQVPSLDEYQVHYRNQGKVREGTVGGFYRPIFLKNYVLDGELPHLFLAQISQPKQWHGSPMATLRRAFLVLGGLRVGSLDPLTRFQLELLRNLYFLPDEGHWPPLPDKSPAPLSDESVDERVAWGVEQG